MAETTIKQQLSDAMKAAMRAKDKERLAAIRLIQSEFKQIEVDKRIEIDDNAALPILDKMLKQRRESIKQYSAANRDDLVEKEEQEVRIIQEFLPAAMSAEEIKQAVQDAIAQSGAAQMQDMGKVMAILKPQLQGRADMSQVSVLVKELLG